MSPFGRPAPSVPPNSTRQPLLVSSPREEDETCSLTPVSECELKRVEGNQAATCPQRGEGSAAEVNCNQVPTQLLLVSLAVPLPRSLLLLLLLPLLLDLVGDPC